MRERVAPERGRRGPATTIHLGDRESSTMLPTDRACAGSDMTSDPMDQEMQTAGMLDDQPLAETKLTPPQLRAGMVERLRLLRALDPGAEASLTLVAAPPGFGKTTAVRAWCERRG